MQTRDEVSGLYNCLEFSQPLSLQYIYQQVRLELSKFILGSETLKH